MAWGGMGRACAAAPDPAIKRVPDSSAAVVALRRAADAHEAGAGAARRSGSEQTIKSRQLFPPGRLLWVCGRRG